jgi:3',5'-cyclic-AMP phosphodiesterase
MTAKNLSHSPGECFAFKEPSMRRVAHLSDVHMLDAHTRRSSARYRLATKMVSMGRSVDPRDRAKKLARALAAAKASGADHVVISGDLTEIGDPSEFEHLAGVLHDARLPAGGVTLVPGNHDAYTSPSAWRRALTGPLRPFASASAEEPGKVVERGGVVFLPIDTSRFQSIARSGGQFTRDAARAVERRVDDPAFRDKTLVLVLHHPPINRAAAWQWIDGLRGCAQILDLLARRPRVQLLHGHLHKVVDRVVEIGRHASARTRARVFGAPAIVDDREGTPRVRIYEVREDGLESAGLFAS